jgi:hypothetical protein
MKEQIMRHLSSLGFLVFLAGYSVFKYQAVPDLMGQPSYMISTAILVTLTAILPYGLSLLAVWRLSGPLEWALSAILPFVLSALGLATFFYLFIQPSFPGMSVMDVLPRALMPGILMGGILVSGRALRLRHRLDLAPQS